MYLNPLKYLHSFFQFFPVNCAFATFISKFDIEMDSISHMPFQDRVQILFIVDSTFALLVIPESLSNFGGVSRRHLMTEEEFFL